MPALAAFVITFDRPQILRATVAALLDQTAPPRTILVLDNKGNDAARDVVSDLDDHRVRYHAMGTNAGPAGAAAYGIQQLGGEGHDWIYWGDDDDPPKTPDTLERLLRLASRHSEAGAVGAVGTRWDWSTGRVVRLADDALVGDVEVNTIAGSSQLLISATAARAAGLPDARLFFGFEEPEYCLRLGRAGHRLFVEGDLMLEYRRQAGRLALEVTPGRRPSRAYAEIWRQYYSSRNYVFSMRTTFGRPDLARRELARAGARVLTAWTRGMRYGWRFSRLQTRALLDGYRGKLGCTVLPLAKDHSQ